MRYILDAKIGEYRIVKVIGRGGNSVVYLGEDCVLGKRWAIKAVPKKEGDALFEARLLGALEHPGIPRAIRFLEDEKNGYLVMEYCPGETLFERCREKSPARGEVIRWGVQLCGILEYLHSRTPPVIYRDMKPGNVMVNDRGKVKLVDFGAAASLHDTGAKCRGTRGFAAPEQYRGIFDVRTDVYNLGTSLLWAAGEHPDKSLETVLRRCICEDPEKRYGGCADLRRALLKLRKKGARQRKIRKGIAACFLFFMVGSILWLITNPG